MTSKFDKVHPNSYTLIDGDIIAYQIAFKIESDAEKANIYIEDMDARTKSGDGVLDQMDALMNRIIYDCPSAHVSTYITSNDKSNYRFKRATTKPYKGNRKDTIKPYYLNAIRDALVNDWDAEVVSGMEADDRLGIEATKPDRISTIATIDKDLLMVDCMFYNIRSRSSIASGNWLSLAENRRKVEGKGFPFFFAQMLLGDTADNIPGINGYGPVKVSKVFIVCDTEQDYFNKTWGIYKQKFPNGSTAKDRFMEVACLLWMQSYTIRDIEDYLEKTYDF